MNTNQCPSDKECIYSKAVDQVYPRLCLRCGVPEKPKEKQKCATYGCGTDATIWYHNAKWCKECHENILSHEEEVISRRQRKQERSCILCDQGIEHSNCDLG